MNSPTIAWHLTIRRLFGLLFLCHILVQSFSFSTVCSGDELLWCCLCSSLYLSTIRSSGPRCHSLLLLHLHRHHHPHLTDSNTIHCVLLPPIAIIWQTRAVIHTGTGDLSLCQTDRNNFTDNLRTIPSQMVLVAMVSPILCPTSVVAVVVTSSHSTH